MTYTSDPTKNISFAVSLKAARQAKGLSQSELVRALQASLGTTLPLKTLQAYEQAARMPRTPLQREAILSLVRKVKGKKISRNQHIP